MTEQFASYQLERTTVNGVSLSRLWDSSRVISMLVPDEWAVGRTEKFEAVYLGPQVEGLQINLGFSHTELQRVNKLTIEFLGKQLLEFIKGVYQNFSLIDEREITIDGSQPGLLRSFSWTDPNTKTDVVQVMLLVGRGNTLYDMTATMAKAAMAEYRPIIVAMLQSIHFAPVTATTVAATQISATNYF